MSQKYITFNELKKKRPYNEKRVNKLTQQMIRESNAMRLAEIRKTMELTQVEMAKEIGVDQSNISRIESGKFSNTEIGTLQAYIEALGGKLEIYARIGKDMHRLVDSD
ncbi:MAG: helix-turn-helix domain-containing protein, partial [Actinomycetes bacterium]